MRRLRQLGFISIRARLSLAFLSVALTMGGLAIVSLRTLQGTVERAGLIEAQHLADAVAYTGVEDVIRDPDFLRSYVNGLDALYRRDIVIVDSNKIGVADSNVAEVGERFAGDPDNEVGLTLQDGAARAFIERNQAHPEGAKQMVVPLRRTTEAGAQIIGAVILEYTQIYDELVSAQKTRLYGMAGTCLLCIAVAVLVGLRVSHNIGRRLLALKNVVASIAAGDYSARVPTGTSDEIGAVGLAFNKMAEDLAAAHQGLLAHQRDLETQIEERTSALASTAVAAQRRALLLSQTEELALIGSSEYDVESGLVTQSAGMFRIFGEPFVEGPVEGEWLMLRVPASENAFVRGILEGVRPGVPCEFEHRIVHADGNVRTVLHRATADCDDEGNALRVISLLQDITAQRVAEYQRDLLAKSDSITRLPNRAALLDHVDAAIRHAGREDRQVALLKLKIDQLKLVTESLGYAAGDRLLALAGERLAESVLAADLVAHIGSGAYAALLDRTGGVSEADALDTAERIVAAFAEPFVIEDTEVVVNCAVGITLYPRDGTTADELLHRAQAAMHRAEEEGGRRVFMYSTEANAKAAKRLAMEAGLRRALERGEFHLNYQPQLDLASGAMVGVEALLRWNDAARGVAVPPDEFIPVAEATGLILPIGAWVLRTACAQNVAWQAAGLPPLRVAVNLSVRQLQQPDIARMVQSVLMETGLDPRHLGLEITESVLMVEGEHVARALGELKAIGIEISIDDFGTGYSNLSYLRSLPVDTVKIDRSCVHDVTAAPHDVSMTRAVIKMAHSLQLRVLAEGVETEGQLALLVANQCDQMQGYFFSRPVGADAIAAMLRERRQLPERLLQRRRGKRTLLLVDDEANIVTAIKRLLRRDGYTIITANSGAEGLQRLADHAVDVIVSDQRMPGMTGVEFLRRAKELCPDTVRIALSGYTELESVTDAINEGAIYKFLTKPWDDERLRGHIAEAFVQKEMVDLNRRLGAEVQAANQQLETVNERLQNVLRSQREQISREETSLVMAQDLLHSIPAALVGTDCDGMIAFANADAEALFPGASAMVGLPADEALPSEMLTVWEEGAGVHRDIRLNGRNWRVACRPLDAQSKSRGKLLVVTPGEAAQTLH